MENISFRWKKGECFNWEEFYKNDLPAHSPDVFDSIIAVRVGTVGPTPQIAMETIHEFSSPQEAFLFGVSLHTQKDAEDWGVLPDGCVGVLWVGGWK